MNKIPFTTPGQNKAKGLPQHSTAQHSTAQHSTAQHSTFLEFGKDVERDFINKKV